MIYKYDEEISYSDASVKTFYKYKEWCARREGRVECGIERVSDEDIEFFQSLEVGAGLVAGLLLGHLLGHHTSSSS